MQIRRLSYALGAEVAGIDFAKPIDDATSSGIRSAFLEHCVLVFRGQPLTREQHIAFGQLFGEVDKNKLILRNEVPGFSEISFVVNKPRPDGEADTGYANGKYPGQEWHSDKSYVGIPSKATVLRGACHALCLRRFVRGRTVLQDAFIALPIVNAM